MNCTCREEHGCIVLCRRHWGELQVRRYLSEWRCWGWPSDEDSWERHDADVMRFWFMRATV